MDDFFSSMPPGFPGMDMDESAFWLEPDFLLVEIVTNVVNLMRLPIGVTLFVKGAIVTGTLVSEAEYLEALTDVFVETARRNLNINTEEELQRMRDAFDFRRLAEYELPLALQRRLERMDANEEESKTRHAQQTGDDQAADDDDEDEDDFDGFPASFEDFDEDDDFDMDDDFDDFEALRHLHLRNVLVLTPSPVLNFTQGVLPIARYRLASIDGWMLGTATPIDMVDDMPDDGEGEVLH